LAEAAGKSASPSSFSGPNATIQSYRLPKVSASQKEDSSGSAFGSYTLPPLSQPLPPPSQRTEEQERRHANWQRLAGNVIPRRRSLALDEAAAAELRGASGIETPEEEEGDKEDDNESSTSTTAAALRSKFSAKEPAPAATAKRGRKKKEEEIGPSGQTYTPLEKQFMEIKAKWPDVLIMMEGGLTANVALTHQLDTSTSFTATMLK
jgi:DNA mismatch repair protein MSH3